MCSAIWPETTKPVEQPVNWKLLQTIIILPGTALVFIPLTIVWLTSASRWAAAWSGTGTASFWIGVLLLCAGLTLAGWTVTLFMRFGQGTPAPWDPPKKLVIRGPYRYVRNPMITSVLVMLLAEALLFRSWPLAVWLISFFLINAIYFPLVEEKGLEKRFGGDYLTYKGHVPRWFPRMTPWVLPPENHEH